MEFEEVVRKRRMIRTFKDSSVSEEKIWRILRNAHKTPSAGNLQPQEYIWVKDPAVKKKLAKAALDQDFVAEAPVLLVVCSDTRRNVWRYGKRGEDFYSITDGVFASMLILLSAVNEGLGACFAGAFDDDEVSKVLDLPRGVRPIGLIPIGYSDQKPAKLERIPLEQIVRFDHW